VGRCGQPTGAGVCHGVGVGEDLWDAYDRMGLGFQQHAADSAYNAHYDRPAVLAALGPLTGRRVLDAACGPGLYLRELLQRGAEVTAFDASPAMVSLARQQTAGRVRIDQTALGEPLPYPDGAFDLVVWRWPFTTPATAWLLSPSSAASCGPAGLRWSRRSTR
jgi:SAM-dependent methyltransferase